jgi:hypothetical protein
VDLCGRLPCASRHSEAQAATAALILP